VSAYQAEWLALPCRIRKALRPGLRQFVLFLFSAISAMFGAADR
jgi:hypothetical protein